jgi:flavorubredoxin
VTRALVVVESMFGNTRAVADAVAAGLGESVPTAVVDVAAAPASITAELLVVGGPTHAFGMSRPSTRQAAVTQGAGAEHSTTGIREWIGRLGRPGRQGGTQAAAFDTRIRKPGVPGSAARSALRRLRRLGLPPLAGPQSFWVTGTGGPLVEGELERARDWGRTLAGRLAERGPRHATRP